jgi:hypothetical protein
LYKKEKGWVGVGWFVFLATASWCEVLSCGARSADDALCGWRYCDLFLLKTKFRQPPRNARQVNSRISGHSVHLKLPPILFFSESNSKVLAKSLPAFLPPQSRFCRHLRRVNEPGGQLCKGSWQEGSVHSASLTPLTGREGILFSLRNHHRRFLLWSTLQEGCSAMPSDSPRLCISASPAGVSGVSFFLLPSPPKAAHKHAPMSKVYPLSVRRSTSSLTVLPASRKNAVPASKYTTLHDNHQHRRHRQQNPYSVKSALECALVVERICRAVPGGIGLEHLGHPAQCMDLPEP